MEREVKGYTSVDLLPVFLMCIFSKNPTCVLTETNNIVNSENCEPARAASDCSDIILNLQWQVSAKLLRG